MGKNTKKGKQASDAPRRSTFMMSADELVVIVDPNHHLYTVDAADPFDEGLVEDVREKGVLQDVGVETGTKDVVFGRGRVKATREANRRNQQEKLGLPEILVPVKFVRRTKEQLFAMRISENVHRKTISPLQLATDMNVFKEVYGASDEQIAKQFNIRKGAIGTYLRLLDAAAPVRKAADEGRLSLSTIAELAKLPKDEQGAALKELATGGGKITTKAAKRARLKKSGPEYILPTRKELVVFAKALLEGMETNVDLIATLKSGSDYVDGFAHGLLYATGEIELDFEKVKDLAEEWIENKENE